MSLFNNLLVSIGSMKAGTSWLYEALRNHPEIQVAPIKEIHYFWDLHGDFRLLTREQRIGITELHIGSLLRDSSPETTTGVLSWFDRYLADPVDDVWFANLFSARATDSYCAEFSNMSAILGDDAWKHIRAVSRKLRIIYTLRNPIERLWSHTRFHAQIIGRFDELRGWSAQEYSSFIEEAGLLVHGNYTSVLAFLGGNFAPDEYFVATFDDMRDQALECLREIESFLGVQPCSYGGYDLGGAHNPSRPLDMPAAFVAAVHRPVSIELEALQRIGFNVPPSWGIPARPRLVARF